MYSVFLLRHQRITSVYFHTLLTWICLTWGYYISRSLTCKVTNDVTRLRHTAAAMRAHNVLCNSYNSITVEMNCCSFHRVRHTAAAMRAHNVLCNSYNSLDEPLPLSSCTFCVVVHSYSFENCIAYFHSSKFCTMWHVYILCVRHIHDLMLLP
jgi:hypothetical protein